MNHQPHKDNSSLPKKVVYFDNTATSFPKPDSVVEALTNYVTNIGANPGRSGHSLAIKAGEIVFNARRELATMFGVKNPMKVVFGFNATDALNTAIKGFLRKGDHVITTAMEHNSTIRPLKQLEEDGLITLSIAEADKYGKVKPEDIEKLITDKTTLIVVNHVSNVNGAVQEIESIGRICHSHNLTLLVDGAQSAGYLPVNLKEANIDIYAFTGHKGLYGTQGTGGLIFNDEFDYKKIKPFRAGGTGSRSADIVQPDFLPDMFESGTLNTGGIAGLLEGIRFVKNEGVENILKHEQQLASRFVEKAIKEISGFKHFGYSSENVGIVSFQIDGLSVSEIAGELSEKYGIMCRHGLHCAPLAHRSLGSFPEGTVRFGFGVFNSMEEVEFAIEVLVKIQKENI
ncbi:MAG: aminotransferase class V-fold PLP-dependent enzyme [Chlorobi bacterium]|nr:aminotransferase class V-fold PLP-dependent enzyme [Chlorobiota bacterium]